MNTAQHITNHNFYTALDSLGVNWAPRDATHIYLTIPAYRPQYNLLKAIVDAATKANYNLVGDEYNHLTGNHCYLFSHK